MASLTVCVVFTKVVVARVWWTWIDSDNDIIISQDMNFTLFPARLRY